MSYYQPFSTPGFGAMWLFSDRESIYKIRQRDYHLGARDHPCSQCGAEPGTACVRQTVGGPVLRRLPHLGRGSLRC